MAESMSNVQQGELMEWANSTDYSGPIGITVKFPVKPSEVANFQGIQSKLGEFARSQSGCKVFALHEDFKDQSCFWLVEEWESTSAWKPYLMSSERGSNAQNMMAMMSGPPRMALYKIKK
eukprot:UN12962